MNTVKANIKILLLLVLLIICTIFFSAIAFILGYKTSETFIPKNLTNTKQLTKKGELEKIDVNNDGNLDLRLKLYDNNVREGYYYFLSNGKPDSVEFIPLEGWLSNVFGERLIFKDDFLIEIGRESNGFRIEGYLFKADSNGFKYEAQTMFQSHFVKQDDDELIKEFTDWLHKVITPDNAKDLPVKIINFEQSKEIILSGNIELIDIPHNGNVSMRSVDGQHYEVKLESNNSIDSIIKECGKKCQFITIGIE